VNKARSPFRACDPGAKGVAPRPRGMPRPRWAHPWRNCTAPRGHRDDGGEDDAADGGQGVVEHRRDDPDGRLVRVYLTKRGREIQGPTREEIDRIAREGVAGLSPRSRDVLREALETIRRNLQSVDRSTDARGRPLGGPWSVSPRRTKPALVPRPGAGLRGGSGRRRPLAPSVPSGSRRPVAGRTRGRASRLARPIARA
jgi:hypothetical protein